MTYLVPERLNIENVQKLFKYYISIHPSTSVCQTHFSRILRRPISNDRWAIIENGSEAEHLWKVNLSVVKLLK